MEVRVGNSQSLYYIWQLWLSNLLSPVAVVPFLSGERSVPAKDCVRREQRTNFV
ncbi:MAG: hypothetical protein ACI9HK_004999 [Pirellulaceae bacterium]|jgi:hypothetical protein